MHWQWQTAVSGAHRVVFIRVLRILAVVIVSLPAAWPLQAQQRSFEIAIVVNDEIISANDLEARTNLALLGSGLDRTRANLVRIQPQVIQGLINEALQTQEMARFEIQVSENELNGTLAELAARNDMTVPRLQGLLREVGIPFDTLVSQIRATLGWRQLVQRRFRSQVNITDRDIDQEVERLRANAGRPQYQVSEILLPVDSLSGEAGVASFAAQLVRDLRSGASFSSIASQFSLGAGAVSGGDLGWVVEGQLAPEIDAALASMSVQQISQPIRTVAGYHILLLRDRRTSVAPDPGTIEVELQRLYFPLTRTATQVEVDTSLALATQAARELTSCEEVAERSRELSLPTSDLGATSMNRLPSAFQSVIAELGIGQASAPIRLDEGIIVFMVCARSDPALPGTSRQEISEALLEQRLTLLQRRYLRDLRADAFIDIRN